ncbi:MAG: beta galactosidase jelly roll domain-containing protein [Azospirillaceae bacterium]|nr:beta galactosidase jelly roll domain-containing protein [Azospirillaceae bacterium]
MRAPMNAGRRLLWASLMMSAAMTGPLAAAADTPAYGPYNAAIAAGGDGLAKPLNGASLPADGPWTLSGWFQADELGKGIALIAGVGDAVNGRYLALNDGRLSLRTGNGAPLSGGSAVKPGTWHHALASFDGKTARLYLDGAEVARGTPASGIVTPTVGLAPRTATTNAFAGDIAGFTVRAGAVGADEAKAEAGHQPDASLINFEAGSPTWPVQVKQIMMGQVTPQDPWTLPKSGASYSKPVAQPLPPAGPALTADGADAWTVGGWRLAEGPSVQVDGAHVSQPGFDTKSWYVATVPGTVLTTLVDRGVYPDPDYGLNNLAIPEKLNRQDYWYRTEFDVPATLDGRHPLLTFKGINYAAEVWLNGKRLGAVRGAFIRGQFDVTGHLRPGQKNVLAVKIAPPPHPGVPHEQSIAAGVGENGGMQALDGPTFIASEGWDWIPAVRDRNTGLWQDVVLTATGPVRIGDTQVVTKLPLPDTSKADITITVPVENLTAQPVQTEIRAAFDDVTVTKTVTLAPGAGSVTLSPSEFPQLSVKKPALWWPNGLGEPTLHNLTLAAAAGGAKSDEKHTRFGIREVSYELSLMDSTQHLRRVEVDPTAAFQRGERVVDGSHTGIHKIAGGWVSSLLPGAEKSPAVTPVADERLAPYLILKVNGVRVPARGGSWGTDDWRKRVSRDRLEPFFRLHREAHVNIIRNWVGQNTEDVFFDLADEYGLMVLNDFWESTQDYNIEAEDVPLFLDNAADVIRRYRNHPSIVMWFGRNEGVPQPVLNEGLENLIATLDGTRYYSGSSNRVNLQDSGPYDYRDPSLYFTKFSRGFAVEVGTPSFPTLEAFQAAVPAADRWPVSDNWAYHDWHQSGNGDTHGFMKALESRFGPATSLADFERKAQMMNYESHRAIFEGMNAGLWTVNSGRLLWMTQPAWPSTNWQIMSHDYDTHGAFYGVQKAAEPLHVQLNLPDNGITVVNNTREARKGLSLRTRAYTVEGKQLLDKSQAVDAPADAATLVQHLDLAADIQANGLVMVELLLSDANGTLSQNVYWRANDDAGNRRLNDLSPQPVTIAATTEKAGEEVRVRVTLANTGGVPALMGKLTLLNADGTRLLPAYASDNYISLMPGEQRQVTIAYPAAAAHGQPQVALRGWNIQPATAPVTGQ